MAYPKHSINPHKLYKDSEAGVVGGVIAGISSYFGFNVKMARLAFCLGTLAFFPPFVIGYAVLFFVLENKPLVSPVDSREGEFWKNVSQNPKDAVASMRHNLRVLEDRLRKLEGHIISREFEFTKEMNKEK